MKTIKILRLPTVATFKLLTAAAWARVVEANFGAYFYGLYFYCYLGRVMIIISLAYHFGLAFAGRYLFGTLLSHFAHVSFLGTAFVSYGTLCYFVPTKCNNQYFKQK